MCVQIHTVCELTHDIQNYTVVPFAYNMKKFPSLEFFYTHAVTGVTDKYEVCVCVYLCICTFVFTCLTHGNINFWYPWKILFSRICHMLGLSGTSPYALFVYLCILYLYLSLSLYSSSYDRRHCPLSINISYVVSGMIMGRVDRGVPRGPRGPKKRSAMC